MFKKMPNPSEAKALYAKLGQTITNPQQLSKWRRDPQSIHADRKPNARAGAKDSATDYDEQMFNELMMAWDQQPENQMQRVFTELVRQAEKAYRVTLNQSQITFYVGISIVIVTFVAEIAYLLGFMPGVKWEQALVGGGVLGGMGIASIVSTFVRGPQSTIQNALGNLAQIEVAFLSFISQSRGFDWSVTTTLDDVERLENLISKLRSETMADIQKYLEKEQAEDSGEEGPVTARRWLGLAAVAALALLAASACQSHEGQPPKPSDQETVEIMPGIAFKLKAGQRAALNADEAIVSFASVSEDSRCPSDVACVWAGQATVLLRVVIKGEGLGDTALTLMAGQPASADIKGYSISLSALDPYPVSTAPITPADYVATLTLSQ